ncbi:MAG: HAMP domain-containing histidine kinase [Hyphomicrobiaceae bacterium]|nr:HAMP domain-containing histidine kinase [Hyphomicrobiaceae bacterium]MCC0009536.1 HAMP domain-containing histidine kinase [Hyphomicrobiaceae bacterium]
MLAEILIFVPSVANYRVSWLSDRLTAAQVASLAAEAVPGGVVPQKVRSELLRTAQVKAVAVRRDGRRRVVLPAGEPITIDAHYDLRPQNGGFFGGIAERLGLIRDAFATFVYGDDRTIRVMGPVGDDPADFIEIVIPEAPLKKVMVRFGLNILGLSIMISLITAAMVYLALSYLLVQPMMRITRNMVRFSENPEDPERIISVSARNDEIGIAERELSRMQKELSQLFLQKNRLAQLGLAVSKINHDLRNMLANAQLISDRLTGSPDPTVQRFAPKLIASLDRAINFCNDSLKFGRAEEATPRRELLRLKPTVDEVADGLGLPRDGEIAWRVEMDERLRIDVDREHLFRVLSNLVRNAVQAIEGQDGDERIEPGQILFRAWRDGRRVSIEVRDNGPGVPPRARENLYRAFQGGMRKGGTGLGLAIAAELIAAHGGRLQLLDTDRGAAFLIEIPDRSTAA